jgi:hypothetical protein
MYIMFVKEAYNFFDVFSSALRDNYVLKYL